jgi:hypothetical protein
VTSPDSLASPIAKHRLSTIMQPFVPVQYDVGLTTALMRRPCLPPALRKMWQVNARRAGVRIAPDIVERAVCDLRDGRPGAAPDVRDIFRTVRYAASPGSMRFVSHDEGSSIIARSSASSVCASGSPAARNGVVRRMRA